jgi:hypothetical protein
MGNKSFLMMKVQMHKLMSAVFSIPTQAQPVCYQMCTVGSFSDGIGGRNMKMTYV